MMFPTAMTDPRDAAFPTRHKLYLTDAELIEFAHLAQIMELGVTIGETHYYPGDSMGTWAWELGRRQAKWLANPPIRIG